MNSPDQWRIDISIDTQCLTVSRGKQRMCSYPVSTAARGCGCEEGSLRTPTGRFRIAEKIGGGQARYTRFIARQPVGIWHHDEEQDGDMILTRILWLDGLEKHNSNTYRRYIYIHGTNREDLLGTEASHGCVRMANADIEILFELVPEGTLVFIHKPMLAKHKLLFLDCDSTLCALEGIDELAKLRGKEIHRQVVALTEAAMAGTMSIAEAFTERMNLIAPGTKEIEHVAQMYLATIEPGVKELVATAKQAGWTIIILSGGFAPIIRPLADELGIEHLEAVPLLVDQHGNYAGYGHDYPTTRNRGKNEVIRSWKAALPAQRTIMIGDGFSDLETKPDVDLMIGYGGVVARPKVRAHAGKWLTSYLPVADVMSIIEDCTPADQLDKKVKKTFACDRQVDTMAANMIDDMNQVETPAVASTSVKGKRYTDAEKQEILDFVNRYNAEHKRGGQSAAAKKFGISQLTISSWTKVKSDKKGRQSTKNARTAAAPASLTGKLNQLLSLGTEIDALERELASKRAKFDALKSSL